MASIPISSLPFHLSANPMSFNALCPSILSFLPFKKTPFHQRLRAFRTGPDSSRIESLDFLRKPFVSPVSDVGGISGKRVDGEERANDNEAKEQEDEQWVNWEDRILQDTVPLVGLVKMILHSGKYEIGAKLSPEHERAIVERLLPYHPQVQQKIGCGIDYITIGYHPDFGSSRCLFISRKDGEMADFSYWKCIKGMIRKNYPLYADNFILRHFRW